MGQKRWTDYFSDRDNKRYMPEKSSLPGTVLYFFLLTFMLTALSLIGLYLLTGWLKFVVFGDSENLLFWKKIWAAVTHLEEPAARAHLKHLITEITNELRAFGR